VPDRVAPQGSEVGLPVPFLPSKVSFMGPSAAAAGFPLRVRLPL
jgi:hypothetical protein